MQNNIIRNILLVFIVMSLFLGNFNNTTIAKDLEETNVFLEKISGLMVENKLGNEKFEQKVTDLLKSDKEDGFKNLQTKDFTFVDDKVRLEIILSDEDKINNLKGFDNDIEIEDHYKSLVQVLTPIDLVYSLSEEEYVQYIRSPVKPHLDVTSEGVGVIGANLVHTAGYYGADVKVAVIDIGFTDYASNPELPSERIKEVKSFRSDGQIEVSEHGTACAEIVSDVAPLADLYLYNFGTISELNSAVSYAISVGIDVISFSIGYTNINNYDGIGYSGIGDVCGIVDNARSNDILFVKSSGNRALSHYEGTYNNLPGYDFHDFGSGDVFLDLGYLSSGTEYSIKLSWDDWPYSNQDYDLILWADNHAEIVDFSFNPQTGSQPPTESMSWYMPYDDFFSIVISRYSATRDVYLELYGSCNDFLEYNHPESSLTCPGDAFGSMTVGATYWSDDSLESFSSRGPTNDGRTKPDVTAPDGVSTWIKTGYFYGTSASAPHTAGAAALLKSVNSSLSADDLQNLLEDYSLDLGSTGKDNLYGSGRIDVWAAYNSLPSNNPPYHPSNPNPANGTTDVDINTDLSWTGGDPDAGDIVTYDVYFGTTNPPTLAMNNQSGNSYALATLSHSTKYYWQIVAWDNHGASTSGPIWSFTTEGAGGEPHCVKGILYLNNSVIAPEGIEIRLVFDDETIATLTYSYNLYGDDTNYNLAFLGHEGETGTFIVEYGGVEYIPTDNQTIFIESGVWVYLIDLHINASLNNPPNTPSNPSPADGATSVDTGANLSWTGGDPDVGDTVTYDVYFGTTNPPPIVSTNQIGTTYDPSLSYSTTYYWQIVAEDNNGASTDGPIWSFTTKDNPPPPPPPSPDTVYVDDDYNDSTPGWQYDHFDNIQDGIDAVDANGTVYVYNGTYYEHDIVIDKTINLTGEDRNNTIIDGENSFGVDVVFVNADWVTISGFTIKNSDPLEVGLLSGIKLYYANYTTLIGNNVSNNQYGITICNSNNNNNIINNIVNSNLIGINLFRSSYNNTILGNNISNNNYQGIGLHSSSSNNLIYNNYFNNTNNYYVVDHI